MTDTKNDLRDLDEPDIDGCYQCGGAGYVVVCVDDICRGADHCMHGDGEINCSVCNKDGEHDWIY